jgi:hypothetical protein
MPEKATRTAEQLRRIILAEAHRHSGCKQVVADIFITRPLGHNWGADPLWADNRRSAECARLVDAIVDHLRAKYDLE